MNPSSERWLLSIIAAASVAMAVALVKREFFPTAPAVSTSAAVSPRATTATLVPDWKDALSFSILDGPRGAPMTLIVLSDLECPACARFSRTLDALREQYPAEVAVAFVHWPLTQIHRFAMPAARAAECADSAGRFTQFAKAVYGGRDSLGLKSWGAYAAAAGIRDTARIARCAAGSASSPRIDAGVAFAARIAAYGTPTVLVNGWQLPGVPSQRQLEDALTAIRNGSEPFATR